jgi:hypothetical protein
MSGSVAASALNDSIFETHDFLLSTVVRKRSIATLLQVVSLNKFLVPAIAVITLPAVRQGQSIQTCVVCKSVHNDTKSRSIPVNNRENEISWS